MGGARVRANAAFAPWLDRVTADGRYLALARAPFRVRGVTYGSFARRGDGAPFPDTDCVGEDFHAIAATGLNTVRVYSTPPEDVLAAARAAGLRLLVGIHYQDWRYERAPGRSAHRRVRQAGLAAVDEAMERLAGDPTVLAVSVGNEVPADVVRVHGIRGVADVLTELVERVHDADAGMLATYTNYPSTEYLEVERQDFASFNVFLEDPDKLRAYLARLQVVVGDRPLVLTELGLAADVHGREHQAASLAWQLTTADELGCAGAAVFSWTDEWAVDSVPVTGWGFGITDEERRPKAAHAVVAGWAGLAIGDLRAEWPRVSVVVCAHNEAATIEECLASLAATEYPELEVIVVDDGSTDGTGDLAARFPCRVLRGDHAGLSSARNAGIAAATGEIVAFLDADAACHPEWPYRLALALDADAVAAAGGPNLPVEGAGLVERAVAASPGGPVEVLLSDDRAEHVPGCNMAFAKTALEEVAGFDPVYHAAGDDVDVCWKLLERGREIAFAPAAQVRHRRRSTVRGYLRQQRSYGHAERLLTGRWRHRMNRLGMARWRGSLYGGARVLPSLLRPVIYHGHMGFAPFQGVVRRRDRSPLPWASALLPLALPVALLGLLAVLSPWWLLAPVLALVAVAAYGTAVAAAVRPSKDEPRPLAFRTLVGFLHVVQPLARLWGRLRGSPAPPLPEPPDEWSGDRAAWLHAIQRELERRRCRVRAGDSAAAYDLQASVGPFLASRFTTAVVWNWTPLHRTVLRPRPAAFLAMPALAAVALALPTAAAVVGGLAAAVALVEHAVLRRRVAGSLRATTTAARPREEAAPSALVPLELRRTRA
jgi:GT2 family glycosyltransferase/exo-beta-1,3-glucanase (GH17 family)